MSVSYMVKCDEKIVLEAGDISIKEKMPMVDSIILASARSMSASLLTSDSHFKGKKDVEYISPF